VWKIQASSPPAIEIDCRSASREQVGDVPMPLLLTCRSFAVCLAIAASACAPGGDERAANPTTTPATAQSSGSSDCETLARFSRVSFIAADRNGEGVIDEAEFARDVAAAFAGEDRDSDHRLTRSELPEAPSGAFERLDSDRSGYLSFDEIMQAKLDEFQRVDTNRDDVLSISEVTRFNAAQHGGC
jgi:hypothetical protein